MTESPRTYVDELRFAGIRLMLLTGFRIGEAASLPFDWKREKTYADHRGRSPKIFGGVDRSLMIRHFAEKQNVDAEGFALYESLYYVPEIFEDIVLSTLNRVERITDPLRKTLRQQIRTGRLLIRHDANDLVPAMSLYTELSGNPFWTKQSKIDRTKWIDRCKQDPCGSSFDELFEKQQRELRAGLVTADPSAYVFFNRMIKLANQTRSKLRFRDYRGNPIEFGERMRWNETYLRIGEVEEYYREHKKTKVPDWHELKVNNGTIKSADMLFIYPKRSLAEERTDSVCDIHRYFSIAMPAPTLFANSLGNLESQISIFERYGQTEDDRLLTIESHQLRHLQNTELFRLGLSDSIITKHFNRKSVAQSYQYDHRSLSEELDSLDVPEAIETQLGSNATTVLKLIKSGKAGGPIVDNFKKLQATDGDDAALEFLSVEADGFHATPYGFCINSFTVDPCPKHLECFAGCRHLSATDSPEVKSNLIRLEGRLKLAMEKVSARPANSLGRENQLKHAQVRLDGVRALLATPPGNCTFPAGQDFSVGVTGSLFDE
jgi:hypothetical protein